MSGVAIRVLGQSVDLDEIRALLDDHGQGMERRVNGRLVAQSVSWFEQVGQGFLALSALAWADE